MVAARLLATAGLSCLVCASLVAVDSAVRAAWWAPLLSASWWAGWLALAGLVLNRLWNEED